MFSTLNLQRWGGLSAVAAGVLLAAGALLQDRAGGSAFLPTGHLPVLPLLGSLLLLGGGWQGSTPARRVSTAGWEQRASA